jgi:hypothetical protein
MSLALPSLNPSAAPFDPFGNTKITGGANLLDSAGLHSGGRSPGLVPPSQLSRPTSRPDFTRGFGLEIPEEEEEQEQEEVDAEVAHPQEEEEEALVPGSAFSADEPLGSASFFHERKASQESRAVDDIGVDYDRANSDRDRMSTTQSRIHSRHVSRLSAALSTRSAGALDDEEFVGQEDVVDSENFNNPNEDEQGEADMELERESDPIAEWTGTEDPYESSDDDEVYMHHLNSCFHF